MRKMMTKEVTKTTVKIAKMEMVDGTPKAVALPDEIILGNVTMEKAQKIVNKRHETPVTVLEAEANTEVYELPVEKFLEIATLKVEEAEEQSA